MTDSVHRRAVNDVAQETMAVGGHRDQVDLLLVNEHSVTNEVVAPRGELPPKTSVIRHHNTRDFAELKHTMNEEQIAWFKAGSALNLLAEKTKK